MTDQLRQRVEAALKLRELAHRPTPASLAIHQVVEILSARDKYRDSVGELTDLANDLHAALLASEEARGKAEVDARRLQAMISGEWYVCFDQDGEQCRVWAVDPRSDDGSRQMTDWHDDPRAAIDAAIQGESK